MNIEEAPPRLLLRPSVAFYFHSGLSSVDLHLNEAGAERVLADDEQFSHRPGGPERVRDGRADQSSACVAPF